MTSHQVEVANKPKRSAKNNRRRGFAMLETILSVAAGVSITTSGLIFATYAGDASTIKELKNSFGIVNLELESKWTSRQHIPKGDLVSLGSFSRLPGFTHLKSGRMGHKWATDQVTIENIGNDTIRFAISGTNTARCKQIAVALTSIMSFDGFKTMVLVNDTVVAGADGGYDRMIQACEKTKFTNTVGVLMGADADATGELYGYQMVGRAKSPETPDSVTPPNTGGNPGPAPEDTTAVSPDGGSNPGTPTQPTTPGTPETPTDPTAVSPDGGSNPDTPVDPVDAVDPTPPVETPVTPVDPTPPEVTPVTPVNPVVPDKDEKKNGNNGHGNDADGNDNSNPGNSNDPNDHTDDDGVPGNSGQNGNTTIPVETVKPGNGGKNPNGNNGHGNDADGNDNSNPGKSNDPNDHTDDDGVPGKSGQNGNGNSEAAQEETPYGHAKTYVTLMLDQSDMSGQSKKDKVTALNAYIASMQDSGEDVEFTLIYYNSSMNNDAVDKNANGSFYNATTHGLSADHASGTRSVFAIQADGAVKVSNADTAAINKMVAERETQGWQFNFMGSNAGSQAQSFGISSDNTIVYTGGGAEKAFLDSAKGATDFAAGRTEGFIFGGSAD